LDGTLIYVRASDNDHVRRRLTVVDANGASRPLRESASTAQNPRVSPDGRHVTFATDDDGGTIWISDLTAASYPRRLTFRGHANFPVWSPDGRRIAFGSAQPGEVGIYVAAADDGGSSERITATETGRVMAIHVRPRPTFSFSDPDVVSAELVGDGGYDVGRNGRLVLARDQPSPNGVERINVVLNSLVEMRARQRSEVGPFFAMRDPAELTDAALCAQRFACVYSMRR